MSEQTQTPQPEAPQPHRRIGLRTRIAAIAMSAMSLGGILALTQGGNKQPTDEAAARTHLKVPARPTTTIELSDDTTTTEQAPVPDTKAPETKPAHSATTISTVPERSNNGLKNFNQLAGYGVEASKEQADNLEKATFVLGSRPKGSSPDTPFVLFSNIVKETIDGQEVLVTDSHGQIERERYNLRYHSEGNEEFTDVINSSQNEFGIFTASSSGPNTTAQPEAMLSNLVISITDGVDFAVGKPDPATVSERYKTAPAMNYDGALPQPGTGVALVGANAASRFTLNNNKGIFVGEFKHVYGSGFDLAVVAENMDVPNDKSSGGSGSSGGISVIGNTLTDGLVYTNTDESPEESQKEVAMYEQKSGIDLSGKRLLQFTVRDPNIAHKALSSFGHEVPPDK